VTCAVQILYGVDVRHADSPTTPRRPAAGWPVLPLEHCGLTEKKFNN
jgi:hypothetical protein